MDKLFDLAEVAAMEVLNDVLVEASLNECLLDLLGDGRSLRRWLQNDTVACEQSGYERVDKR